MRIPVFAANWKMHKTLGETLAYVREFGALAKNLTGVEIVLAPPFTAIASAAEAVTRTRLAIAAQDLYFEREGAFTGEVSATMIKDAGATHVIIGHSERRRLFGETDDVGEPQAPRRAHGRPRRRSSASARRSKNARPARRSPSSTARFARDSTGSPATKSPRSSWPTSRCGRSARAATRPPPRRARRTRTSARGCVSGLAGRRPIAAGFCTADRSSPRTSASSRASKTSTARSWAARASKRARSSKSSAEQRPRS